MSRPKRDPEKVIWDAELERDFPEPLSAGEETYLDDWYERETERMWP